MALTFQARAKLNLSLGICGKREDGYHLLQSLVCFTELADTLEFEFSHALTPAVSLDVYSEFPPPDDFLDNNLILKSADALLEIAGKKNVPPVKVKLHKRIPMGAGLGGGSADAAATLQALNSMWQLNFDVGTLVDIATNLGSDIAACIFSKPLWLEDTGNILTSVVLELPPYILLAYPQAHASTKAVYERFQGNYRNAITLPGNLNGAEFSRFMDCYGNDLEAPSCSLVPEIAELLDVMRNLQNGLYTRMTGSGSACFSFFEDRKTAEKAAAILKNRFPDFWVHLTRPYSH